jgi:hypothetical protein
MPSCRHFFCLCLACTSAACSPAPAARTSPTASSSRPAPAALAGAVTERAVSPAVANGEPSDTVRADDWFEDVTERTGIQFSYRNGREGGRYYILETLGGGVALFDFDRDGGLDVFCTGGGTITAAPSPPVLAGLPAAIFRNQGSWQFADVTEPAGFAAASDYSLGCAVVDFDADGWEDLFVCCYGRSRLFRNMGDGTFGEAADAGQLPAFGMGTTAAWADIDHDGLPDLFLARYIDWTPAVDVECRNADGTRDVCGPASYAGTTPLVFHNGGDGGFENWSARVGLKGNSRGLGVLAADLNADGWVDFYIANDESPKQLYPGAPDLPWVETGVLAGVAFNEYGVEEGSMGVDVGDVDGDGRPDLWVTNFENEDNALYHNVGSGTFHHASVRFGLSGVSRMNVGFGTTLSDLDSDGWLDIVVLNGNPLYEIGNSPFKQLPQLFRNQAGRRFENVSPRGGTYFRQAHAGRALAVGDIDGDGALDLVAGHLNDPVRILRNRRPPPNFVRVRLRATRGETSAVGARVRLADFRGQPIDRYVARGGGYFSHSDSRLVFPVELGADVVDITVDWPGRRPEIFRGLAAGRTHDLVEGRGEFHEPR